MSRVRSFAPAALLLFAGCNPPPETAPRPTATVEVTPVRDANTQETLDNYTVRSQKFVSNATADGKFDDVWSVLPEVYKRFALPVDGITASTHTITTGQVHVRRSLNNVPLSRYMECGRATLGPNADIYDINLKVETVIAGKDGAVAIHSSLTAVGSGVGNGGAQVRCSSSGELESRIAAKIAELLPRK